MRSIRTVTTFYSMTLQRNNKNDMNNDTQKVIDAIMTRTSVRQYTDEPITDQEIETLLKAGMAAPSACNLQPWRFVVVTNPVVKKAISEQIKPAGPASKAPVVIVVCGDMDHTFKLHPTTGQRIALQQQRTSCSQLMLWDLEQYGWASILRRNDMSF